MKWFFEESWKGRGVQNILSTWKYSILCDLLLNLAQPRDSLSYCLIFDSKKVIRIIEKCKCKALKILGEGGGWPDQNFVKNKFVKNNRLEGREVHLNLGNVPKHVGSPLEITPYQNACKIRIYRKVLFNNIMYKPSPIWICDNFVPKTVPYSAL